MTIEKLSDEENEFAVIRGVGDGPLFERVLGRAICALAAHSDNLMISRGG